VVVSSTIILLILARTYWSIVTGYLLPDESYYYNLFIVQKSPLTLYRPVFHLMYLLFFQGTTNATQLFLRGAVYSSIWGVGCIFCMRLILGELEITDRASALVLISLPLFPVFTVMALFFVTETFALFFAFLGVLFLIRYLKRSKLLELVVGAICLALASEIREPYSLLLVGCVLAIPFLKRGAGGVLAIVAIVVFVLIGALPFGVTATSLSLGWTDVEAFFVGLGYGFGPLFALLIPVWIFMTIRLRTNIGRFVTLTMLLALVSFAITSDLSITGLGGFSIYLSDIIRLTSTAVPAAIGLGYLYSKIRPRYILVALLIYAVAGAAFVPQLGNALQTSQNPTGQPVDRLSLGYRAPYFRLYELALTAGKTLIIAPGGVRGIIVYASLLPDATLAVVPPSSRAFAALLAEGWNSIFLYSEGGPLTQASALGYPAYYRLILFSGTHGGFDFKLLWNDSESYAVEILTP